MHLRHIEEREKSAEGLPLITVGLPCPVGSDYWWVDPDTKEVKCEKGGIKGFVILKDRILALDASYEHVELNSPWCCLTRREAEEFSEKMFAEK